MIRGRYFMIFRLATLVMLFGLYVACQATPGKGSKPQTIAAMAASGSEASGSSSAKQQSGLEHATFAMGCFWHSEEIFSEIKGVTSAVPGYSGGKTKDPTYEEVGSGTTGHAESVDVTFDPKVVTYGQLLQVFFTEHDPTTPNYSAPDEGPQYRSALFYRTQAQKQAADSYIASLTSQHYYKAPIVTEVAPLTAFYRAEDYHIHYFRLHPDQGYIANVTRPEVEKFRRDFPQLLK